MSQKALDLTEEEKRSLDDLCGSKDVHVRQRAKAIVTYAGLQSIRAVAKEPGV